MNRSKIRDTGVELPSIIFGTSALGNLYSALSDEVKLSIITECFKYVPKPVVFDCAGKYGAGLALETLGKCLHKLGVGEEDVVICNKLGWIRTELKTPEPTFEPGVWHNLKHDAALNINFNGILECFEQGNELLGSRYKPRMLSIHDPDEYISGGNSEQEKEKRFQDILEGYNALALLKKQGKVKAIGVGAKNWQIIQRLATCVDLDWVMFANSLTIMQQPAGLLSFMEELHQKGIGIINSAVFHSGFLTGGDYFDYKLINPDNEIDRNRILWRDSFFSLCEKNAIPPALACVQFAMTPPGVVAVSLNTSNPGHVRNNVESVSKTVPPEFYREMADAGLLSSSYPFI